MLLLSDSPVDLESQAFFNRMQMVEDVMLKQTEPEAYHEIKRYIDTRREEREKELQQIISEMIRYTWFWNIDFSVQARVKNFFSIYMKMESTGKDLSDIYDYTGIRFLCHTVQECYLLLTQLHRLFFPVSGRCKNYIEKPKPNGYQSLHTTVIDKEGRLLEIQIRTREMHQRALTGSAAHHWYKPWKQAAAGSLLSDLLVPV
jgi:GTP diphosphokinase / guanosine-3',5'-bis(diphosphate) 3'-diphosphatase